MAPLFVNVDGNKVDLIAAESRMVVTRSWKEYRGEGNKKGLVNRYKVMLR